MVAFSLLVATLDRIEEPRRLLASLTAQSCHDFEILIADQNPPGFLDGLYAEFQDRLQLRVISVPNKGLSLARNALLPHARGTFIAFPDDDCWYRSDTLEQAATFFTMNPQVHGLLGQWHDPDSSFRLQPLRPGHAITRFWAIKRGLSITQFYRKEVVDAVGDFDPEFGVPHSASEDTDYLLRALARGFIVVSAPSVQIYHPDAYQKPSHSLEKVRSYSASSMHLFHKHNLPLWFKLAVVAYPLLHVPFEGRKAWPYRKTVFLARLAGLFAREKPGSSV